MQKYKKFHYFCNMKRTDLYAIFHTILLLAVCIVTFFLNNRTIFFQNTPYNVVMTQRMTIGIAATLLVLFIYLLGKEMSRREDFGWIAALLFCTSYRMILFGRQPSADVCCHAAMAGAIYFIFCTFREKQGTWFTAICGSILLGISYLCSGLLSFYLLLFPFLIVFPIGFRPLEWKRWKQLLTLLIIGGGVGCLSYLQLDWWNSDIAHFIFGKPCLMWGESNSHSWYYYGQLLWNAGPWMLLFLSALIATPWIFKSKEQDLHVAALLWLLLQFILVSVAPHKDSIYLIALMMPLSYLLASLLCYWNDTLHRRSRRESEKLFVINAYLLSALCLALPIAGYWLVYKAGYMIFDRYLLLSIYTLIISGCLFIASWKRAPYFVVYGVVLLLTIGEVMM